MIEVMRGMQRAPERSSITISGSSQKPSRQVYENLLDNENVETTQPTLSKEEAHSYFSSVYSSSPHVFVDLHGLREPQIQVFCST